MVCGFRLFGSSWFPVKADGAAVEANHEAQHTAICESVQGSALTEPWVQKLFVVCLLATVEH